MGKFMGKQWPSQGRRHSVACLSSGPRSILGERSTGRVSALGPAGKGGPGAFPGRRVPWGEPSSLSACSFLRPSARRAQSEPRPSRGCVRPVDGRRDASPLQMRRGRPRSGTLCFKGSVTAFYPVCYQGTGRAQARRSLNVC